MDLCQGCKIMKIAFLLKGAISKSTGKSSFPDGVYREGRYVNFVGGANSIKKHIVEANPDCEFDFFLHSWHPDLGDELVSLYNPTKHLFESNDTYKDKLLKLLKDTNSTEQFYGQAAMCLSFKKVTELLRAYVEETHKEYDLVIFYRYDILLWKDMKLSEYLPEKLYVDADTKSAAIGDFHFVMNYDNAIEFGLNLYDSISKENPPRDHRVVQGFVKNYMNSQLTMDDIVAGEHQEVIRKLASMITNKKLPIHTLESFGITMEELLTYNEG